MKRACALGVTLPLLALLAACDRSDPPSDRLERAAEELVSEVEATAAPEEQPAGPWAPRDECDNLPGATDFRASLQAAIDTRDGDALLSLAADDVKLDFGGGAGHDDLRALLAADDGAMWETLASLLELGCAATDQTTMTLPWYFAQEIPVDPYAGMIVMGENVLLLDSPSDNAPVLAQLSWEAVQLAPSGSEAEVPADFARVSWIDPATGDPLIGFVASDALRSIIDYRLIASRRNERWRITALIAGD